MPRPPAEATGITEGGVSRSSKTEVLIEGSKLFVIRELIDIGYLRNRFDTNLDAAPIRSLVIRGVLVHDGEAIEVNTDERISFDSRANLTKYLTAVRGGTPVPDDEVVDFNELVGVPIQVTVKSQPVKNGQGYWLRISDPASLVEGTPTPDVLRPYCVPADGTFVWLDEERLAAVKRKLEPAETKGKEQTRPPDQSDGAIAIEGSEIHVGVWREVAPVLRRILDDRFGRDITRMHDHFEAAMQGGDAQAADVLGFIGASNKDPAAIVFKFGDRTDADARDLAAALTAFDTAEDAGGDGGDDRETSGTEVLEQQADAETKAESAGELAPGDLP